ncbi:MAG: ABC transporter ATP-binding protein [Spirochaetales bacterium]|nr:ABC transporter ATP-binding protein [Spirochaetales bacterium]
MIQTLKMVSKGNGKRVARISLIAIMEALFGSLPYGVLFFVLFDIINNSLTIEGFTGYTLIIILSAAFRTFFSFLGVTTARNDGNIMIKELRMGLGEHIRKLPLGFFNTHDMGDLSNKLLDNVNKIEMIITMLLPPMISTLVLNLLVAGVLFFLDYRMALAALITMPLSLLILTWARSVMDKQGRALYDSSSKLADCLLEFVNGIKFIKSFNNSDRKYQNLVTHLKDFKIKSLKTEGTLSPIMVLAGISIDFGLVMLILTGSYLMMGGTLSTKEFLIFIVISSRFFEGLKALSLNWVKVKYLGIAGESIMNILNEELMEGTGNDVSISEHTIAFRDVRFSYGDKEVLKGIDLRIKENTLTALVGPSGSGKSTMINLMARFFDVDSGEITIGSHNIKEIDPESLLKNISMVFQNVTLFSDTIYNNIRIGKPDATEEEIILAAQKANAHDFIQSLPGGYQTMVGENGANLSGGEKQRISIARAILKDTPIVLLDEATSSLDPENEIYIQEAISRLLLDKTVIVIAHRLKTIKEADRILVFREGEIVEEGEHSALLEQNGLYSRMWEEQENALGWTVGNQGSPQ